MADEIPTEVEKNIAESIGEDPTPRKKKSKKFTPSYRVIGNSKVPVAKTHGKVWKTRKEFAMKVSGNVREAWEEAIKYFDNDQVSSSARKKSKHLANPAGDQRLNNSLTETENIVFANVTTMVPALYSRNPKAEFTSNGDEGNKRATQVERLVNVIGSRKAAPGINFKPKAKRCVVTTLLTNRSWMKVGWTFKGDSNETALATLEKLAQQLLKAKSNKKIQEIEGKIEALEMQISILDPAGPSAHVRSPFHIHIDPNAQELDLSDAKWLIDEDYLPTDFLIAKFGKTNKDGTEVKSLYQPSHVMKVGKNAAEAHEDEMFSIFEEESNHTSYGYEDKETFDRARMTKVNWVWDKVTRRLFLYNDADWTWPIWVWDDPLQLDTFFPYFPLSFFSSPSGPLTKGEVTYYLDQQDALNSIVDEKSRWRAWAKRNVFFNQNVVKKADVELVLNGPDGTATGLDLDEGVKLGDVVGAVLPPSIQYAEVFNTEATLQAIDRISSVGQVMRGEQFKTNTNTSAVQATTGAQNIRVDEKTDNIEDWTGAIYWAIGQLCLMHMTIEQVTALIGKQAAEGWQQMSADEIRSQFSVIVVGGSTKKPTSAAKKAEALEMAQVLGQFVNTPAAQVVMKVMLEVLQEAFDEVTISEDDWQEIIDLFVTDTTNNAQGAASPTQPINGGEVPSQQQEAGSALTPEQLEQAIAALTPEMQQIVAKAIEQGIPPEQALEAGSMASQQPVQ